MAAVATGISHALEEQHDRARENNESTRINRNIPARYSGHGETHYNFEIIAHTRYITLLPIQAHNFLLRFPMVDIIFSGSIAGDVKQLEMLPAEGNDYLSTRPWSIISDAWPSGTGQQLSVPFFCCADGEMRGRAI